MPAIIVVGAGISGLAIAYQLQQLAPAADVTVLEAAERPGGTTWTHHEGGFTFEMGPNGFLDSKPATLDLSRDVGLESQLIPASPAAARNRFLFLNGELRALPASLLSLLSSDLLSWRGKLSLLLERFRQSPMPLDESVDAFARRRTTAEIAKLFVDALVTGIYAGDRKKLSLPACFPRLAALEREHGSVLKGMAVQARQRRREGRRGGQQMWSFAPGLRLLVETLVDKLRRPPLLGRVVNRIERLGERWRLTGEGQDRWDANAVVLACPAHQQAAILDSLDPQLAEEAGAIPYNRIAVVALGYRAGDIPMSLDGFGFIAPQHTRRDVLGVQWCSSIFPGRAPAGMVLLRAMCGGWQRPEMVGWDDDRLLSAVRAELRLAQGITAAPVFHRIVRWERAIPQYHLGHLDRLRRIDQRLLQHPGLFLAGNAYRGVALNDCTEQGRVVAEGVVRFLA